MWRLPKWLEDYLGLVDVNQEVIDACANRIKIRCAKLDITTLRRKAAQQALEKEAIKAIVATFQDYNPGNKHIRETSRWPHAICIIRGNQAWIEPWLGIDYEDPDEGLEVISFPVDRVPERISVRERIDDILFNRTPRKASKQKPQMDLTERAPPKRKEPAPIGAPLDAAKQKTPQVQPAKPKAKPVPARKG